MVDGWCFMTESMQRDSLKINRNDDGSFTIDWDKNDPNWKWLNNLTSKEIQSIMEQAIKLDQNERGRH